jgi:hypothetical protein
MLVEQVPTRQTGQVTDLGAELARIHERAQRTYRELARLYRQLDELGEEIQRHEGQRHDHRARSAPRPRP